MLDPEMSIEQAIADYKRLGYSDKWINNRIKGIEIRKELTDEWDRSGVTGQQKLLCHVPKASNMRAVSSQQLKDEYKYYKEPSSKVGYLLIRLKEIEETDIELKDIVAKNEAEKKLPYWWDGGEILHPNG